MAVLSLQIMTSHHKNPHLLHSIDGALELDLHGPASTGVQHLTGGESRDDSFLGEIVEVLRLEYEIHNVIV